MPCRSGCRIRSSTPSRTASRHVFVSSMEAGRLRELGLFDVHPHEDFGIDELVASGLAPARDRCAAGAPRRRQSWDEARQRARQFPRLARRPSARRRSRARRRPGALRRSPPLEDRGADRRDPPCAACRGSGDGCVPRAPPAVRDPRRPAAARRRATHRRARQGGHERRLCRARHDRRRVHRRAGRTGREGPRHGFRADPAGHAARRRHLPARQRLCGLHGHDPHVRRRRRAG